MTFVDEIARVLKPRTHGPASFYVKAANFCVKPTRRSRVGDRSVHIGFLTPAPNMDPSSVMNATNWIRRDISMREVEREASGLEPCIG